MNHERQSLVQSNYKFVFFAFGQTIIIIFDKSVILEVAILNVKSGLEQEFEIAFKTASAIIASMPGYICHELQRCIETKNQYILLVRWQRLEDHTVGFRQSPDYQEWRSLLHHFYDPFPTVEHYESIFINSNQI